ncbi:unnamed protein product [Schistosoma rodhaini]|uniref:FERM domain-containing protein n=1 Tax=Schistosoma rodhaini TaxID=6188 RepID=A0AA85GKV2_9TREM|nr:unnamed protein product [Schistosoma rodhaini]
MSCALDTKCFAVQMKLTLLDENFLYYSISVKTKAGKILNNVVTHLKITHPQYFGIKVQDRMHNWHWLHLQKNILSQMKLLDSPPVVEQSVKQMPNRQDPQCMPLRNVIPVEPQPMTSLTEKFISSFRTCGLKTCTSTSRPRSTHAYVNNFHKPLTLIYQAYLGIKYYPPDPTIIADEQTRYQIFIQVRNDLISGRMQVDENLFVTLCGLILQSDCGDYGADRLGSNYVKQLLKLPNLNEQLEERIKIKHEDCRCRQPALVEYQLLDKVKQLSTYGQIKFHIKETISNTACQLCLGPSGVSIEDSRKNLIQFSWPHITGFSHKHKQILIKILNEGTRFTYRCSVDNSEICNSLLETCKNYLNFYRNEISQRIINEPHQSIVDANSCSNSTVQPICYTNSSLDKTESPFIGNELNLPKSNYPIHVTDSVQPVAVVNETINCKFNRSPRPLFSSLIEFNPGYLVKSPVPSNINTIHDSKCTIDSCDFYHHPSSHYCFDTNVNDSCSHQCYHPTAIPINPYHVRGTSGVFYRPRGCETVTDIGDHPHIYANRRSHCPKYNHARLIMNDPNELKSKHRRRSFPKTKHYFIEEDFDEDQFLQKHSSLCPTLYNDNCQSSQCRSNTCARSSAYREFHQLDTILPITTSSFKSSFHGRPASGGVPRRSHRILPRPVSRLDRYPERCSSPVTTDESQDTIENYENHDANNLHEVKIKNHTNMNNNHISPKISVNHALEASVAQSFALNNLPNKNKLGKETHELIQIRSNEQDMQQITCNSPRDCHMNSSSRRIVNRKSPISSSPRPPVSIIKSSLPLNSCGSNGKPSHQSNSSWYPTKCTINKDDNVFVRHHDHQHPKALDFSHTRRRDDDKEEIIRNIDDDNNNDSIENEEDSQGLTDLEHGLFNMHQYATTVNPGTTPTDSSFCSSSMYCVEESETPSLLKNSDINSELCESICTSLIEFQLPPTPSSSHNQDRTIANGRVEESNSDSNLPSPPSNDFLHQLRNYKLDNEKQMLESNLENVNCTLTVVENTSNDTGFCSRSENKRGRRLPLLPYERSMPKSIHSDRSIIVSPMATATSTSSSSSKTTTTGRTESMKINRPNVTQFLSPTPSPRMSKTIVDHQKLSSPCTNPMQEINETEILLHPDEISECDLV